MNDPVSHPDRAANDVAFTRIKEWRTLKKMTLEQLSEATEISVSYLSRMEGGKRNVSFANLKKIAQAMNITPRELMPHLLRVPLMGKLSDNGEITLGEIFGRAIAQESSTSNTIAVLIGDALGTLFSNWVLYYELVGDDLPEANIGNTCVVTYISKNANQRTTLAKIEEYVGESRFNLTMLDRGTVFSATILRCRSLGALVPSVHAISQWYDKP